MARRFRIKPRDPVDAQIVAARKALAKCERIISAIKADPNNLADVAGWERDAARHRECIETRGWTIGAGR